MEQNSQKKPNKAAVIGRIILFCVIVAAVVFIFVARPIISAGATPVGPKFSFGGEATFQMGCLVEDFNKAGAYCSRKAQESQISSLRLVEDYSFYKEGDYDTKWGTVDLINKKSSYQHFTKCMIFRLELRLEDGAPLSCNGIQLLGSTKEEIHAALGAPNEWEHSGSDRYKWKGLDRSCTLDISYDKKTGEADLINLYHADSGYKIQSY